jgi:hypothetical protein
MIEHTSFLGLPLRTASQRRLLVVLYNGILAALAIIGFCRGKGLAGPLLAQTFVLGGLLGGIRAGGPVKPFTETRNPLAGGLLEEAPITLGLNAASPGWRPFSWTPLDERERVQRDRAHYCAYRILLWILLATMLPYSLAMIRPSGWLTHESSLIVWLLLIVALSLPQSVLLWTEPNEPVGELQVLLSQSS